MNWANRITLSRLALTVLFVATLNSSWQYARTTALVIFLIAGLTDFVDGEIARRYGVITNFGKLMDPLVDKIMMAAAFISLVPLKAVPAWAATAVVARDFLITGLRLMASAKGRILPAERLGKQKTSWQIITIIFFLAPAGQRRAGRINPHKGRTNQTQLRRIEAELRLQLWKNGKDGLPIRIVKKANEPKHPYHPPFVARRFGSQTAVRRNCHRGLLKKRMLSAILTISV